MDDSSISRSRNSSDHLGVNKVGKNIKKSPIHQPNFTNAARQQTQPQVYNINKNDFRNIVQQLTGSPSREPRPRPPQIPPKQQSTRLQKFRPPPLTPMNRPQIHMQPSAPAPAPTPQLPPAVVPHNNNLVRPPAQFGQPSPTMFRPSTPADPFWPNVAESPVSAYMHYLHSSFIDPTTEHTQAHGQVQAQPPPQHHPPPLSYTQFPGQMQGQQPLSGLLPNPSAPPRLSPHMHGPLPIPIPAPRMNDYPSFPSPRLNRPPILPLPTSQFHLPSPTGFFNLLSPRSPYPLLSPGYQYPPPLTPNFALSPRAQSGILGPGPQPLLSPGVGFPMSPSAFFSFPSPLWRDQQS